MVLTQMGMWESKSEKSGFHREQLWGGVKRKGVLSMKNCFRVLFCRVAQEQ